MGASTTKRNRAPALGSRQLVARQLLNAPTLPAVLPRYCTGASAWTCPSSGLILAVVGCMSKHKVLGPQKRTKHDYLSVFGGGAYTKWRRGWDSRQSTKFA